MTSLCCGLDIGSTNLKAVLVDETGRVRWAKSRPTPRTDDGMGPVTDAAELLRTAEDLILEGWRAAGEGRPILAFATAGVGEDGLPLGRDLAPAAAAIPWFDERAAAEADELAASDAASPRLGLCIDRFRAAAKWFWLSRHRPDALQGAEVWVALTDYPAVAWSGRVFMSETLAARSAAYDVYRRGWHASMLEASHAPPLPEVVTAGTAIGPVLPGRLREAGAADAATLVVAGGHDHPVAASFIRRFEPEAIVDSMGTAEVVYGEMAVAAPRELDPRMAFSVPVLGGPGLSCLGVLELAAALAPYRGTIHGDLVAAVLAGETPASASEPPAIDPAAIASFSRDQALALTADALTETVRRSAALIEAVGAAGEIYTTGGWSRSDRFLQMRADIFGRPIVRFDEDELTGAGAALIAWSALRPVAPAGLTRPGMRRFDPSRPVQHAAEAGIQPIREEQRWL